ncbi:hypothetical protein K438DRAFT_2054323 [Mycena galopus ATCC 62051]|nr:hypothetical protein K438DRAFT_2054323 [Mycena galopus ATCC 62051]
MPSSKSNSGSSIRSLSSAAARKLKGVAKTIVKKAVSAVKAVVHPKSQSSCKNDDGDGDDPKSHMRSGVYQFFEPPKLNTDDDGRKYQFFKCAAPRGCKHMGKGTTRFQTNKNGSKAADRSSTSNLLKHARKCWGADIVEARMKGIEAQGRDGDIFAAFARASDRPINPSDRTLTEAELRAHIVRWVTESHRPLALVEDREFRLIFGAGRPEFRLPGRRTVSRDLNAAYGLG